MKNLTLIVLCALAGVVLMQGCDKTHLQELTPTSKLKVSSTQVNVWQADTLLFTGAAATDSLTWTVTPAANSYIHSKGNAAVISFGAAGTYVITTQKAGGVPASVTVKVVASTTTTTNKADTSTTRSDITNSTSDTLQLVPISNDVTIAVGYYRKPAGDSVRINFMPYVGLDNHYCRNAIMQYKSAISADNKFNLDLINIRESVGCTVAAPPTPDGANTADIDVFVDKMIGFGTYPLTITVGTTVYTGSIVVSASSITFNWPYTAGVIFPDKVITQ